eukprot:3234491-Rhodomonas_salina.1
MPGMQHHQGPRMFGTVTDTAYGILPASVHAPRLPGYAFVDSPTNLRPAPYHTWCLSTGHCIAYAEADSTEGLGSPPPDRPRHTSVIWNLARFQICQIPDLAGV